MIEVIRSLYKLAKREFPRADSVPSSVETPGRAVESVTVHTPAQIPAEQQPIETMPKSPGATTTQPISAAQLVPRTFAESLADRRIVHNEKVLEHEREKFAWRQTAFDRRLDFAQDQLGVMKDVLALKRSRAERDERIIYSSQRSFEERVPICTYCGKGRHYPSNCPDMARDGGRTFGTRYGDAEALPVIDITPNSPTDK